MRILILTLSFLVSSTFLFSQSSGFLGQRFKVDLSFKPSVSLGGQFLNFNNNFYYSTSELISTKGMKGVLLGNDKGVTGRNIFSGTELTFGFILSRKDVLSLTVGKSKFLTDSFFDLDNSQFNFGGFHYMLVPQNVTNIQVAYELYSGLAPAKRFFKLGLGFDIVTADSENIISGIIPSNQTSNLARDAALAQTKEEFSDFKEVYSSFIVGIGTNNFITSNLYYKLGLDFNFYFAGVKRTKAYEEFENENVAAFLTNRHAANRMLTLNLGLGYSF